LFKLCIPLKQYIFFAPLRPYLKALRSFLGRVWPRHLFPKGLYARALIIVLTPVILLQAVVAYVFMERHWQTVTRRLSAAVTSDISLLIAIYEQYPHQDAQATLLTDIAAEKLGIDVDILLDATLPPPADKPFFSILDRTLSQEISKKIARPFWIDTVGKSNLIEIRIQLDGRIMRIIAHRNAAYASNSHIFMIWMVGSSLLLLGVAVLVLGNQIRPILRLAEAAESFGKGRDVDFRPRGAREVRQAGRAFIEMKRRIERAIDQRTAMLNGVSHDLRTLLTRFRLSLELLPASRGLKSSQDLEDLRKDVDEMSRMLEGYLAFARGESEEQAVLTNIENLLENLKANMQRQGTVLQMHVNGIPQVIVRPDAFRRLLYNLVGNALRHGTQVRVDVQHESRWLLIHVDDDGTGIPEEKREEVFKPFVRLDDARNQDEGGSGLGLAIARDIARSHGGDILLTDSPLGGLRATVRLPV
jgi:two-component system, OmpR family, osmolarity sensor histidine kinase EnvZ